MDMMVEYPGTDLLIMSSNTCATFSSNANSVGAVSEAKSVSFFEFNRKFLAMKLLDQQLERLVDKSNLDLF